MQDTAGVVFIFIGLSYLTVSAIVMERFRRRALRMRGIVRSDLRRTAWRIVIFTLLTWAILSMIFLVIYLVDSATGNASLTSGVLFCLFGFAFYAAALFFAVFWLLRRIFRLPLID